jgi:hypothetical protein
MITREFDIIVTYVTAYRGKQRRSSVPMAPVRIQRHLFVFNGLAPDERRATVKRSSARLRGAWPDRIGEADLVIPALKLCGVFSLSRARGQIPIGKRHAIFSWSREWLYCAAHCGNRPRIAVNWPLSAS